jgi:hypothetical protein
MQNKKAMVTTVLVDFWSIVAFILIILLFYFIIGASVDSGKAEMEIRASEVSANAMLESYLRTPVNVDGREIQMSEFIIEVYYSKEKLNELIAQSSEIIKKSKVTWNIDIEFPDGKKASATSDSTKPLIVYAQASAILPTPDSKTIKVVLYNLRQK